jgi:hypothetical protein
MRDGGREKGTNMSDLGFFDRWLQSADDDLVYEADGDSVVPTPAEPPLPGAVDHGAAAPAPRRQFDLRTQPEIFAHDRNKPQILDAPTYVENVYIAVGFASACWREDGVFDTEQALRLANELCAYLRLLKAGQVR